MPPPSPCCDWTGVYIGLHAGGQFGHSEDEFIFAPQNFDRSWGYSESGLVGGGQVGYNWQWHWLVLGPEFDVGYMNLDGRGQAPRAVSSNIFGESDSDFYVTFRGRIGVAVDCWLFYATGGGIGVNYDTRQILENEPAGLNGHKQEFDWGYTVGGGIERKIGCHWSIKVEYLYYAIDQQSFDFTVGQGPTTYNLNGETAGHIVRAGLNYHF